MKRTSRRTAPAVSKKAPSTASPSSKKLIRPLRDLDTTADRGEVRALNRRVTPSRQSNRRGRSAGGK